MAIGIAAALLVVMFTAVPAVYGTQHIVGGALGWTDGGVVDYAAWAATQQFYVGDTLLFTYGGNYGVEEVSQDGYANCMTTSPVRSYSNANTVITLTEVGTRYFTGSSTTSCEEGMKLAVTTMAAASGTSSILAPPPPPGTKTTGTTPIGTTLFGSAAGNSCNANDVVLTLLLVLAIVFVTMV